MRQLALEHFLIVPLLVVEERVHPGKVEIFSAFTNDIADGECNRAL